MTRRRLGLLVAETAAWQLVLSALWIVLVSRVDPLEVYVGLGCALPAAIAAVAARRVVSTR
ncbi:hypothetical protein ABZ341_28520 [Streptomyces sp. NPDC006173]|uniref:hypothetical protein n=1 Tax=Streptomyces sp. NPDC006173 TaxID=3155349 RepID=UPI003406E2C5